MPWKLVFWTVILPAVGGIVSLIVASRVRKNKVKNWVQIIGTALLVSAPLALCIIIALYRITR